MMSKITYSFDEDDTILVTRIVSTTTLSVRGMIITITSTGLYIRQSANYRQSIKRK